MAELYEQVWVMELDTAAEALFALVPDALHRVYRLQSTSHQNLFDMFGYRYEHLGTLPAHSFIYQDCPATPPPPSSPTGMKARSGLADMSSASGMRPEALNAAGMAVEKALRGLRLSLSWLRLGLPPYRPCGCESRPIPGRK